MKIDGSKIQRVLLCSFLISISWCISNFSAGKGDTTSAIDFEKAFTSDVGDSVLAVVGNKKITIREFLAGYEFGPAFVKRKEDSKSRYLKYMIDEKLLALDGYKRGFADSSRVKELLAAIRGDLATTELFKAEIFNKIKISQSEINKALAEKQFTYQVKWLYFPQEQAIEYYSTQLRKGVVFDSLFQMQLKDSVYADQRSMKINKFKLRMQNQAMYNIIDTMKAGEISNPVKGPDGWYIVKLIDIWKNMIETQTEIAKEKDDAVDAIKLNKSDKISDTYVRQMMLANNPVIQARAFDILRSYLGKSVLKDEKYKSWKLDDRMQKELDHFNTLDPKLFSNMSLVQLSNGTVSLDDFLNWYRLRDGFLKFEETDFNSFSASLEKLIWQMVRDHLLVQHAYAQGFQNKEIVKQQSKWWEDKIIYAVVRDELANAVGLNVEDPAFLKSKYDNQKQKLVERTFRKIQQLKKVYKVWINEKTLKEIKVNDSDNPRTIDTYFVKKGGTFPHPAFPSIDYSWQILE